VCHGSRGAAAVRAHFATDWVAGGRDVEQSVELSRRLKDLGVDLIDVSTGGNLPSARIPVAKRYQVPCSRRIRDACILTGTVGLITDPKEADEIVTGGNADPVLLGASCCANRIGR
jgi:2,4-dienoyl-CoA reductase-like NADH-dependent reductase (Old Yellow Enzyme family)